MRTQLHYVPGRGNTFMPAGGDHLYRTWQVRAPFASHWRVVSCAEVECEPHRYGWACTVITGSDDETDLLRAAAGATDGHRRRYTRQREPAGFVRYVFPAGQACLRASTHRVSLERPYLWVVRDGDWRGNRRGTSPYRHANGNDWVDHFATHLDRLPKP